MTYSDSTFTIEINGVPAVVLRTKWHAKADEICRLWAQNRRDQLTKAGPNGFAWPPFVKLRLSRADEKAAYEDESKDAEIYDDVKVVYLVNIPIVS